MEFTEQTPQVEAVSLWDSPLFVSHHPDHEFLKQDLLDIVYRCKATQQNNIASEVAVTAKNALYESDLSFLELQDPAVMEFKRSLEELISAVASEVNQAYWPEDAEAESTIIESWYHVTQQGGYHDVHSHPNCSWCGIYYLEPGECDLSSRNGVNRFYDPRVNAEHYSDPGTAYISQQGFWDFEPAEGQIVIFPSYLKHSALPYFGKEDRVIIAFNSVIELF